MKKLSAKRIKELAQDDILHFAMNAFNRMPEGDEVEIPVAQIAQFHDELRKQYIRVQKLFNVDSEYFLGKGV